MKKKLILLSTVMLFLGMVGIAGATPYSEVYSGTQALSPDETYNFGFDFWFDNTDPVVTDSDLKLTSDAKDADYLPWKSVRLFIDFSSWANAEAKVILTLWDEVGDTILDADGAPIYFISEVSSFNGTFKYSYMFTDDQADNFEGLGWGNIAISNSSCESFVITKLGMEVTPVPEPSTVLLIGAGLLWLTGVKFQNRLK